MYFTVMIEKMTCGYVCLCHIKMLHDIVISRMTHHLEIIHNIHSCKIYVSRMRYVMYPYVYYIEQCYTHQTSYMVNISYETSYKENI